MENKTYKVGQELVIKEDITLKGFDDYVEIKKGDKAYVDGTGFIHCLTGKAKGKICLSSIKVKGYDYENIAEIIFNRLNWYNLDEFLESNKIDKKEFIEEIENSLINIL